MRNRIKLIAYWLYLWAALCLIGIYWVSGVLELAFAVILAGLFYQAGTGILKTRNRDRKIAIGLLGLLALMNLDTVIGALSSTTVSENTLLVMFASAIVLVVSSTGACYLFKNEVADVFKGNENA